MPQTASDSDRAVPHSEARRGRARPPSSCRSWRTLRCPMTNSPRTTGSAPRTRSRIARPAATLKLCTTTQRNAAVPLKKKKAPRLSNRDSLSRHASRPSYCGCKCKLEGSNRVGSRRASSTTKTLLKPSTHSSLRRTRCRRPTSAT